MTDEATTKRGRVALTPEQKAQRDSVLERYHGLAVHPHTISTSIKVTAKERAILRSFCKSQSKPFFGTSELMAGILNDILLGRETSALTAVYKGEWTGDTAEYVRTCAAKYDAENESPEVLSCKKEIAKYEAIRDGYTAKELKVPAAITGIIDFHKSMLAELLPDYTAAESEDDETTE